MSIKQSKTREVVAKYRLPDNSFKDQPSARYKEIGARLKAYRLGSQLNTEEVAAKLGVSRAAVYRIEAGEVVKIETLERLAALVGTSLASILGVGTEYYAKAISYFERMRQLEEEADQVIAHFEPFSYLLSTPNYHEHLRQMILESIAGKPSTEERANVEALLAILAERKDLRQGRRLSIINLVSVREIEGFLRHGLIGSFALAGKQLAARKAAARAEIEHLIKIMSDEPMGIQIGVVEETVPNLTFQLFRCPSRTVLALSPFRLGELPNIHMGVAMVTAAEEVVSLYESMAADLWSRAYKGARGATLLKDVLTRFDKTK